MTTDGSALPSLEELGRDLLVVPIWKRVFTLATPFVLVALFFVLAAQGEWLAALVCPVLLSFLTYGSISHDLVHRTLRLPRWLNELLLSIIELMAFRSGHAYRVVHLHHHASFPAEDDLEGAASRMSFWRALVEGPTLQPRLWFFAMRRPGAHRPWAIAECAAATILFGASLAAIPRTIAPIVFALLMIGGSWIFPVITAYIPHNPSGATEMTQTRLFRGRVLSWLAMEHLYHLEHHLYPGVPHHNWPGLAARLDPHFARAGLKPIKLLF
ncbi:MAG TPA: fatty acid desaturase [Thermoanaerobaculia bacterium]|nr:fatty acid desaturase [Thermoanaerobaculia bacterium]